ncbi:hypothetical protein [Kocuria flava]|uniref:putative acetyltransferase n=1 Tax=Kocuria flava TaxID=446860 RepID=UPI002F94817A
MERPSSASTSSSGVAAGEASAPADGPAAPPGPPSAAGRAALRLLTGLPAGTRVSVRRALPDDDVSGLGLTDALGELVRADEDGVTVRTRRGDVVIAARDLRAARAVPPPPPRRAPRGRPVD